MSEEAVSEPEGGDVFNMEGAVETISEGLFSKAEPEVEEEIEEEVEETAEKEEETEEKAEKEEKEEEKKEETEEKINLPSSWKKDMEERWGKLDKETQAYVLQREDQMREGLEKDRGDANLGRTMRDIVKPYEAILGERGLEAPQAVQHLLQAHYALTTATPENKIALLNQLAKSYGVGQKTGETNPEYDNLAQRLEAMERNVQASQQRALQAERTRTESEVNDFAEQHPHFDELSDDIVIFVNAGLGLEEAYQKALKLSDGIQEKELESKVEERLAALEEERKKEAEEAKKAKSVNVRGRDTNKAPTAKLGTMEDTMWDVLKKKRSQN